MGESTRGVLPLVRPPVWLGRLRGDRRAAPQHRPDVVSVEEAGWAVQRAGWSEAVVESWMCCFWPLQ